MHIYCLYKVDQGDFEDMEIVPEKMSTISRITETQSPVMSLYYKQDDNQVSLINPNNTSLLRS